MDVPQPPAEDIVSLSDMLSRRQRARFKAGDLLLGRYRILGELGQGGMGLVYRCLDEVGGIEVALKTLPPEVSHDTGEMEEVRENFRIVRKLQHPNITGLHTLEKYEATGDYLLVMELAEGVSLRQWRKAETRGQESRTGGQTVMTVERILPILRQIAAALDYAHSQKVIHRDIKPANVMIAPGGTVKVLDFGLAAQIQTSFSRVSHMRYGTSGTGPYMAPEQWRGQRQDGRTDQYAFAVLVYELLYGRRPFENAGMQALREAALKDTPERPVHLSKGTWAVLLRALAKQRDRRFSSCTEFVGALAAGQAGRAPGRGWAWSRGLGKLAMAAGVLAALGLAGWWGWGAWQQWQAQQAQERARAEAESLDERKKAAAELRGQAERLLASGALREAGEKLTALANLGAPASDLAGQLEGKLGERETNARYNEVALAHEAALKLDRGGTLGAKLDKLELKWREAEAARQSKAWGQALKAYDSILALARAASEDNEYAAAKKQRDAEEAQNRAVMAYQSPGQQYLVAESSPSMSPYSSAPPALPEVGGRRRSVPAYYLPSSPPVPSFPSYYRFPPPQPPPRPQPPVRPQPPFPTSR